MNNIPDQDILKADDEILNTPEVEIVRTDDPVGY